VRPRSLARAISLVVLVLPLCGQELDGRPRAVAELRRIAGELEAFPTGDWFYGRPGTFPARPEFREPMNQLLAGLEGLHVHADDLLALLGDDDPRVRTLALAKLVAQGPPEELARVAELVQDDAPTFPRPKLMLGMAAAFGDQPAEWDTPAARELAWHVQQQTVGQVARELLEGIEREGRAPGWGWRSYRVLRATQGVVAGPVPGQLELSFALAPVDELPPVLRELTFVALWERHRLGRWIDERRAFRAARRLGRERLLALLTGELELEDPDFDARDWEAPRSAATRFVLRHASELLRREDADLLAELGHPIAAAELDPARAAAFLRPAVQEGLRGAFGYDEARAVAALWRLAGEEQADFVLEWLFSRAERERVDGLFYPLIDLALDRYEARDRRLLARLVRDPRVAQLNRAAFEHLVRGWNENLLEPIASEDELRQAGWRPELRTELEDRLRSRVEGW
jgi:hypothetical protein